MNKFWKKWTLKKKKKEVRARRAAELALKNSTKHIRIHTKDVTITINQDVYKFTLWKIAQLEINLIWKLTWKF